MGQPCEFQVRARRGVFFKIQTAPRHTVVRRADLSRWTDAITMLGAFQGILFFKEGSMCARGNLGSAFFREERLMRFRNF
jgi:hypothetical protein